MPAICNYESDVSQVVEANRMILTETSTIDKNVWRHISRPEHSLDGTLIEGLVP